MLILDTNHISEIDRGTTAGQALYDRLSASAEQVCTTIVSLEEQVRGRLAQMVRARNRLQMIEAYRQFQQTLEGLPRWVILPWNAISADVFDRLKRQRLNIGTMDLRIAAIAIASGATLLSRNLRDFARIPDLKVEDWLS